MGRKLLAVLGGATLLMGLLAAASSAQNPTPSDPRVGLPGGLDNAGVAQQGMDLLAHLNKPEGFSDPENPGATPFWNSDMAFQDRYAFVGSYNGFNVYDIANPARPTLRTSVVCPGGQGDVSVYGNLLFMSVQETRAKKDCTLMPEATPETRFRGVRVFDISNIASPVQVAAVQTCRGSHTHTLVTDKDDPANVYVYNQGTSTVRAGTELEGCNGEGDNPSLPNPSRWRIEIIKVPVAQPQDARIVNEPRLFRNDATGAVDGLQNAPQTPKHPSGLDWGPTPSTDACHDITAYPEIELAAGACEGNGLLIDISDPADPKRIDVVADPLYAYWHGATFSNDGKTVVFTDEWGGGTQARCQANHDLKWGGNAVYEIVDRKLQFRSYYKLPAAQTAQENCVSHLPSLIPVPGRDIFVQAWYQGGASLVDFTDPAKPKEIGYFDRGPVNAAQLTTGGFWAAYWYNGAAFGSEMARGFDVWDLKPTQHLSKNEIAAAREAKVDRLNVQRQDRLEWDPSFAVVRSFLDQANRTQPGVLDRALLRTVSKLVDNAERKWPKFSARIQLKVASGLVPHRARYADLRQALKDLADS